MEKLSRYIEILLVQHDYVIVPGLGGFIIQPQSAMILSDRITPPLAGIAFNPLLNSNDGLLAYEISEREHISYRAAMEILESEVESILSRLQQGKRVDMGNIGSLQKNSNGNLIFSPAPRADFLPANLGMTEVKLWERRNTKTDERKKVTITLPSVSSFRYAAACALIFGMLLVSPRMADTKHNHYANLIPLEISSPLQSQAAVSKNASTSNLATTYNEKQNQDSLSSAKKENIEHSLNNQNNLYHVIAATFYTRNSAEKFCVQLHELKYTEAHVLSPAKNFKVAVRSFRRYQEAVEFMEQLRKSDALFDSAWVYCK
ncbi:MAG: hypothetical protein KBA43_06825 [Paludibacteraceae bacterium]|jgi:hypothetical protein|nr:hypothetical protein [Paludibacteraceae bacterium]